MNAFDRLRGKNLQKRPCDHHAVTDIGGRLRDGEWLDGATHLHPLLQRPVFIGRQPLLQRSIPGDQNVDQFLLIRRFKVRHQSNLLEHLILGPVEILCHDHHVSPVAIG